MWRMWLLFDPRRTLIALVHVPVRVGTADPLHPSQYGPFQLAGWPSIGEGAAAQMSPMPAPQ